jgi:hypothetical protein
MRGPGARSVTRWGLAIAVALTLIVLPIVVQASPSGASSPPALTVSPAGNYTNTQTISVSVGANGYFTPHSRVNILECSDPGGLESNLPKDDTVCDGNTIQGSTILVANDGSFSVSQYPVYLLPSSTLGEQSNFMPVCNQTDYCVLYVGQNQNDFTTPKVFSAPFLVSAGSGASAPAAGGTVAPTGSGATTSGQTQAGGTSAGSTHAASGVSAGSGSDPATTSATTSSGALADTGIPGGGIEWMVLCGAALLLTGSLGRRLTLRARR